MTTRIVTNTEIKAILQLGSSSDALIDIYNDVATGLLCEILGVQDIAAHTVTDERVCVLSNYELILNEFPVNLTPAPTIKDTLNNSISGYSFKKEGMNRRTLRSFDSGGTYPSPIAYSELLVTYNAGYTIQDTLKVLLQPAVDSTVTVKIAGVSTTYTFKASGATGDQINIGATVNDTAANIATKFGATVVTDTVTLPLGSTVALGTAAATSLQITSATLPAMFKIMIALIAGGAMAEKDKASGISSYSIGGKSVTFRNDEEASAVQIAVKNYLPSFKKVKIIAA